MSARALRRTTAELEPYEAIVAHTELQLELAGRGEVQALAALSERWRELTAPLPARPPATAAPLLARAALLHERVRVELLRLREQLRAEIARTAHASTVAERSFGRPGARPRLDRRA